MNTFLTKFLSVWVLYFLFLLPVLAQNKYLDYGSLQKKVLFKENFDNQNSAWWLGVENNQKAELLNGYYVLQNLATNFFSVDTLLSATSPDNYEFEMRLAANSSNASSFQQIMVGERSSEYLVFAFNAEGVFKIAWKGERKNKTICKQNTNKLYSSASNKLTIRKLSSVFYFFINEGLVYSTVADSLSELHLSFSIAANSQVKIDYIQLLALVNEQSLGPPTIVWENPSKSLVKSKSAKFNLKAMVYSAQELLEVSVYQNNELIEQKIKQDLVFRSFKGFTYLLDRMVDLETGHNQFKIVARNENGKTDAAEMEIIHGDELVNSDKRLALVIGNSNYKHGPKLKNAVNDAVLMSRTLEEMGFTVIKLTNGTKSEIERSLRNFADEIPNFDVALFYFAGHGIQTEAGNFILPTDAKLDNMNDLPNEALALDAILKEFGQDKDKAGIVILDACRDNPFTFADKSEVFTGFRSPITPSGTIVSFSTSEGTASSDGTGQNGLYTQELVKQMLLKIPIEEVLKETRKQVEAKSAGAQSPQEWSKLVRDFYFRK